MSTKKLLVLVSILIVLGLVYNVLQNIDRPRSQGEISGFFTGTEKDITGMTISHDRRELTLANMSGTWVISGEPFKKVDVNKVDGDLAVLMGLRKENLVASHRESHSLYGIDSGAVRVTLTGNGTAGGSIILGRLGPDYQSQYAQAAGEDNVYLVSQNLSGFRPEPHAWLDRLIYDIGEADSITAITVIRPPDTYVFEKQSDSAWLYTKPDTSFVITDTRVVSLKQKLRSMFCLEYTAADSIPPIVFTDHAMTIVITTPGETLTLTMYNRTKDKLLLLLNDRKDFYYLMGRRVIDTVMNQFKTIQ